MGLPLCETGLLLKAAGYRFIAEDEATQDFRNEKECQ